MFWSKYHGYNKHKIRVLEDIIDLNVNLTQIKPLDLGIQKWIDGNLIRFIVSDYQIRFLPESLEDLYGIKKLDLCRNELKKIPESIGNLSSLINLNLYGNELTELPESIGNLTNLENLDLGSNKLTKLPESMVNLDKLKKIDITYNMLSVLPESYENSYSLISDSLLEQIEGSQF